ncbi:MAG: hypothetical protein N2205_04400 [Candidatus Caldatribacterium sp.]|uniref:MotE family protein n=1 Tax=Candidatus Caldatribacterium sp. TaxID=2282143 RepID=UPI00299B5731|nr:hypothetical protein [Candidatus Caldatribacterium sp.]MCX7730441.1 hypothetical protein [Candidatus Caldatribacterium sp.]MDW8080996.1 hypothetical protein [Candidatus Calescibacterium sp.]
MQGRKAPRVAKEKIAAGSVPRTKGERRKGRSGETVLLVFVFGVTFLIFLQFTGMVDLPFLRFLPFGKGKVEAQREAALVTPKGEEAVLYPGPTLEGTPLPQEGAREVVSQEAEGATATPQVVLTVTPLPVTPMPSEVSPSPAPSPTPSGLGSLARIARIYSAMEPQDAARILEQWSDEEVVQVLSAMKERDAARILNAMSVEKAASVLKKMREGR